MLSLLIPIRALNRLSRKFASCLCAYTMKMVADVTRTIGVAIENGEKDSKKRKLCRRLRKMKKMMLLMSIDISVL